MTTVLERAGAPSADVGFRSRPAYVRDWAQRGPQRVAMREKDFGIWQEITWADYWSRVVDAAHGLLALGVHEGDRVSTQSEDRPEWLILDMATVAVRAITVGLYSTSPATDVRYLLSDSGSVVHLAEDQEQAEKVMEVVATLANLRKIIHIEPRGFRKWRHDDRFISWDDFLELGRRHREGNPGIVESIMALAPYMAPGRHRKWDRAAALPSVFDLRHIWRYLPQVGVTAAGTRPPASRRWGGGGRRRRP